MPSGLMGYVLIIVILPLKLPVNCTFHTQAGTMHFCAVCLEMWAH